MKGVNFAVLVAALLGTTAAHAEPIWKDLDTKMTEADVQAAFGKKQKGVEVQRYYGYNGAVYQEAGYSLVGGCVFNGPGKTLNKVIVDWFHSSNVTADQVEQDLRKTYGEPVSKDDYRDKTTVGFIKPLYRNDDPHTKLTWKKGDILVTFDRETTSFDFTLTYEVMPSASLGL